MRFMIMVVVPATGETEAGSLTTAEELRAQDAKRRQEYGRK